MANIFLNAGETRNGGLVANDVVFGSNGTETVVVPTGPTAVRIDGNVEGVTLANAPASYTFLAQGNNLVVFSGGVEVTRIIVQDDANGTQLTFPGGSTTVNVGAGGMTIGGTSVATGTAAPVVPGNLDPNAQLIEALGALSAAQAAEEDFLEGVEALDTNLDGTTDVDAGDVTEADISTFYTNASAEMQTATGVSAFATRSATVQDAAIADALENAGSEVEDATADAATGVTNLLGNLEVQQAALADAQEAFAAADETYDDEVISFNAVNSGNARDVGDSSGDLNFVGDEFGVLNATGGLSTTYAELVGGEWQLTAAGTAAGVEIDGIDDLYAADQDLEAATTAQAEALDAVEAAVEAIIVAETGAVAVADNGSVFDETTGAVNLSATNARVYATQAQADRGTGAAAIYTVDLAGASATVGETLTIDGVTVYTAAGTETDEQIAAALVGDTVVLGGVTYDIAAVGGVGNTSVTLTARTAVDETDSLTIAGTVTPPTQTTVEPTVEGVTAGTTVAADISDVADLQTALTNLEELQEDVAAFQQARELSNQIDDLNDATVDAGQAITADVEDGGLGYSLLQGAQVNFTADDDVYLYAEGPNRSLTNFSVSGDDLIYFGEGFDLVELGDDEITDNVGNVAENEIFWEQVGGNVLLYVEEEPFAGNSSAGAAADITVITLVGVDGDQLTFTGGFLSSATTTI
jgi:hypothetical protein